MVLTEGVKWGRKQEKPTIGEGSHGDPWVQGRVILNFLCFFLLKGATLLRGKKGHKKRDNQI